MMELRRETRRGVLAKMAAVAGCVIAGPATLRAQKASPQPMASPNAPTNQNVPGGLDGSGLVHQPGAATMSPLAWSSIKSDAEKLLQMATDLKTKVDQTDLTATLSLPLIKEARQIEKMAKQIQAQMKS